MLAAAGVLTLAPRAMASDRPAPRPTLPWLVTQLLPSPELAAGDGARFGLSWQLTPVLYSFGIHRRLSPWRSFVVEPLTRQSGSIELFAAPAYLAYGSARDRWSGRVGVRSYFPLVQRGENLSLSLGSYYFRTLSGEDAVAYELGSYVLYGFIGMRFAVAPAFDARRYLTTLSVRAF
ncbi:MAG: hypothetical protein KC776_00875 [Myxococcales bacterium]|nr:hypothetical protein [Myxococcales bacterium]MCB9578998.1 hypothetical protein [Polyangiaceae bacterium]